MGTMNIQVLVQEFYALEAISAMLIMDKANQFEPMRHSHERWFRDFIEFRDTFDGQLASAIFDYTVLVVAAELRHANKAATHYINGYYNSNSHRDAVFHECSNYSSNDILSAGVKMFDKCYVQWYRAYGGPKWRQIAKAGLWKGKISNRIFIDHCVDLSHNSDVYLDKDIIFHLNNPHIYKNFLDIKWSCIPQNLVHFKQGPIFGKLLWRANNLHIIDIRSKSTSIFKDSVLEESEFELLNYEPIQWGSKRLDISGNNIIFRKGYNPMYSHREQYNDRIYERRMAFEQAA